MPNRVFRLSALLQSEARRAFASAAAKLRWWAQAKFCQSENDYKFSFSLRLLAFLQLIAGQAVDSFNGNVAEGYDVSVCDLTFQPRNFSGIF